MARLTIILIALAFPAYSQATCGERAAMVRNLQSKYGEYHIGGGLQSGTKLIEIWTNGATGSFTILLTRPTGKSCIVSSGQHWDSVGSRETLTFDG